MNALAAIQRFIFLTTPPGNSAFWLAGLIPVSIYVLGYFARRKWSAPEARSVFSVRAAVALLLAGLTPVLWIMANWTAVEYVTVSAQESAQTAMVNDLFVVVCRYDRSQVTPKEIEFAQNRLHASSVLWYSEGKQARMLPQTEAIPCDEQPVWINTSPSVARVTELDHLVRPMLVVAICCSMLLILVLWSLISPLTGNLTGAGRRTLWAKRNNRDAPTTSSVLLDSEKDVEAGTKW
jgi:hypothetical protein